MPGYFGRRDDCTPAERYRLERQQYDERCDVIRKQSKITFDAQYRVIKRLQDDLDELIQAAVDEGTKEIREKMESIMKGIKAGK